MLNYYEGMESDDYEDYEITWAMLMIYNLREKSKV